jgi:hypothetical protein
MTDTEHRDPIPLDELDEETRQKVLSTRRDIKIIGFVSIGLIVLMTVLMFVAVALAFAD